MLDIKRLENKKIEIAESRQRNVEAYLEAMERLMLFGEKIQTHTPYLKRDKKKLELEFELKKKKKEWELLKKLSEIKGGRDA